MTGSLVTNWSKPVMLSVFLGFPLSSLTNRSNILESGPIRGRKTTILTELKSVCVTAILPLTVTMPSESPILLTSGMKKLK